MKWSYQGETTSGNPYWRGIYESKEYMLLRQVSGNWTWQIGIDVTWPESCSPLPHAHWFIIDDETATRWMYHFETALMEHCL